MDGYLAATLAEMVSMCGAAAATTPTYDATSQPPSVQGETTINKCFAPW